MTQGDELAQLRQMVAEMGKRMDKAQRMILERDAVVKEQAERLAERDAKRPGHYNLIALRNAADNACSDALDACDDCHGEAVNWGDLQCVGAERYTTDEGTIGHRVWIEECDPAAHHLREFVRGYLERAGFAGVDVMLEW